MKVLQFLSEGRYVANVADGNSTANDEGQAVLPCGLNGPIACVTAIPAAIPRPNGESESQPRLPRPVSPAIRGNETQ